MSNKNYDVIDIQIKEEPAPYQSDDPQICSFNIKIDHSEHENYHKPSEFQNNGMSLMSELQIITDLSILNCYDGDLTENIQDNFQRGFSNEIQTNKTKRDDAKINLEEFNESNLINDELQKCNEKLSVNSYSNFESVEDQNTKLKTAPVENQKISQETSIQNESKSFECTECGESFTQKYNQHIKVKHQPLKTRSINTKINNSDINHFQGNQKAILKCSICTKTFSTDSELREHLHKHKKNNEKADSYTDKSINKIKIDRNCKVMLEDIQLLNSKKHAIKESNQKRSLRQQFRWKSLECNVCGQRFSENKVLAKHMMQHQNAIPKCPIGEKTIFDRVSNMDKDFQKHDNNIPLTIVDRNGGKKIMEDAQSTETAMIKVKDGVNISSKDHLCQFCGKKFSRNASLKLHKRTVHEGVRDFICKVCGKKFTSRKGVLYHEQAIHQVIHTFECEICGVQFGSKSYLNRHVKIHQVKKHFACEKCGKQFSNMSNLSRHHVTHTGIKAFQCEICKKQFSRKGYLKKHQVIHKAQYL